MEALSDSFENSYEPLSANNIKKIKDKVSKMTLEEKQEVVLSFTAYEYQLIKLHISATTTKGESETVSNPVPISIFAKVTGTESESESKFDFKDVYDNSSPETRKTISSHLSGLFKIGQSVVTDPALATTTAKSSMDMLYNTLLSSEGMFAKAMEQDKDTAIKPITQKDIDALLVLAQKFVKDPELITEMKILASAFLKSFNKIVSQHPTVPKMQYVQLLLKIIKKKHTMENGGEAPKASPDASQLEKDFYVMFEVLSNVIMERISIGNLSFDKIEKELVQVKKRVGPMMLNKLMKGGGGGSKNKDGEDTSEIDKEFTDVNLIRKKIKMMKKQKGRGK